MKYAFNLPARARGIAVATVLLVVMLVGAFFAIVVVQHERDTEDRLRRAERVARAVESHLRQLFERVDAILRQTELELGGRDFDVVGPAGLEDIRVRALATAPAGFGIGFWRRDGTTPLPGGAPSDVTLRDRDFFPAIFDPAFPDAQRTSMLNAASGNIVGGPVFGRVRNLWLIPVVRPLAGPDGAPSSFITATVPLSLLTDQFAPPCSKARTTRYSCFGWTIH